MLFENRKKWTKILKFLNIGTTIYFVFIFTLFYFGIDSHILRFLKELTIVPMLALSFFLVAASVYLLVEKYNLSLFLSFLPVLILAIFFITEFF